MFVKFLLAGTGGFVGAVCRYGISVLLRSHSEAFPWATLGINVLGCFLIGLLQPMFRREELLIFVVPGILGGFTTFSAFGHETHELVRRGTAGLAVVYVLSSVVFGLGAVWLGRFVLGQTLK
jgi:CrcB protein